MVTLTLLFQMAWPVMLCDYLFTWNLMMLKIYLNYVSRAKLYLARFSIKYQQF